MADTDLLDIVDDNDKVIGQATRKEAHEKGLQHREIHVWFVTPQREIIFQKRSAHKDRYPNLLDATVGGHVEAGMDWLETAVKELAEETGLIRNAADLIFVGQNRGSYRESTGKAPHRRIQNEYALLFTGSVDDLKIEEGEGGGFEAWPIDKLPHLTPAEQGRFISAMLTPEKLRMYAQIADIADSHS